MPWLHGQLKVRNQSAWWYISSALTCFDLYVHCFRQSNDKCQESDYGNFLSDKRCPLEALEYDSTKSERAALPKFKADSWMHNGCPCVEAFAIVGEGVFDMMVHDVGKGQGPGGRGMASRT